MKIEIVSQFRIPCNWDLQLLDKLEGKPVSGIFGMLPSHIAGGGRPSAAMPSIAPENAAQYIRAAKEKNIPFNYLFNAPCTDAQEFTKNWRDEFLRHLDWALEAGISAVTVSIPYLLEVIKKYAPGISITVSSYARINSLKRAMYFQQLGADELVLDPITMTRDLACLKSMAQTLKCTVTLIANGVCLYQCPYAEYHGVLMGHSSQQDHISNGFYEEYPFYNCTNRKLLSGRELVSANFIRPEDIALYEQAGIRSFKLVDRSRPTAWILNSLDAYISRRYDGDLLQILNFPHFFLNLLCKKSGQAVDAGFPCVDNRGLDGFLEQGARIDCRITDCDTCGICEKFARSAVTMPEGSRRLNAVLEEKLRDLDFSG